jgi:1-acyl-sn-glycerol-3-phosphate acyltransferase
MLAIFSVLYWAFFMVTLPVGLLVAYLVRLVSLPFDRKANIVHLYTCLWGRFYIAACPIWTLKVVDRHRLPKGPAIIVSNHESLIDILVLFGLQRPFKWVSKASNFKLPFVGSAMRLCKYIPVERGDRESVIEMMELCRDWLRQGVPVLIFPEGTRSRTGQIQPFKDGAFTLALETGAPIVPIAMDGTGSTLPKHGIVLQSRMDAVVRVLDPIDPSAYRSVESLREATRAAIAGTLGREAVVA